MLSEAFPKAAVARWLGQAFGGAAARVVPAAAAPPGHKKQHMRPEPEAMQSLFLETGCLAVPAAVPASLLSQLGDCAARVIARRSAEVAATGHGLHTINWQALAAEPDVSLQSHC